MSTQPITTNVTLPKAKVSYPNLFKPVLNKLSGKMEYNVQGIFDVPITDPSMTPVKKAVELACEERWGADKKKWPKNLILPFKNQDDLIEKAEEKEKSTDIFTPNGVYITVKTAATSLNGAALPPPVIVDRQRNPITDPNLLYAGCYARFNVTAKAYPGPKAPLGIKPGVSLYLNAVQFVEDGERLGGGRPSAEQAFEALDHEDGSAEGLFT